MMENNKTISTTNKRQKYEITVMIYKNIDTQTKKKAEIDGFNKKITIFQQQKKENSLSEPFLITTCYIYKL